MKVLTQLLSFIIACLIIISTGCLAEKNNPLEGVDLDSSNKMILNWRGSMENSPAGPEEGWAYYNTIEKTTYFWDGTEWQVLSIDGADGEDGLNIIWMGSFDAEPEDCSISTLNSAFYNTSEGKSFICNGITWDILSQDGSSGSDGVDGISISWLGTSATPPVTCSVSTVNNGYYDSSESISYICDGSSWTTLSVDGIDGSNGAAGANGISISWLGSSATEPDSPNLNEAYYNTTDSISYIWDGDSWETLAVDGVDGLDGAAGSAGADGVDGISISWLGTSATPPVTCSVSTVNRQFRPLKVSSMSPRPRYRMRRLLYCNMLH
jgi:hypothetical protein